MKILLLNPKTIYESWPFPDDFWRCMAKVTGVTLPQLAATIPGYQCDIYDGVTRQNTVKEYFNILSKYDVIALTIVSPALALNTELNIKIIRKNFPNKVIILGGHHATAYHKEWIDKGVHIVVRGEGEETFPLLMKKLSSQEDLAGIEGITYWTGNNIRVNKDRDFISQLDSLPLPSWDKVDLSKSYYPLGGRGNAATIETSRGCKHQCIFCNASQMWRYSQRYKSVRRVIEEFKLLYKLGVDNVSIADDNFGSFYERDREIFEQLIIGNIDVYMWAFMRTDTVLFYPDFIKLAARAGLKEVLVGFESDNDREINFYNKKLSRMQVKDYLEVYRILQQNNIMVFGSFVTNSLFPEEPDADSKINPSHICDVAMYMDIAPIKGSKWFEKLEEEQLIATNTFYYTRYIPCYKAKVYQSKFIFLIRQLKGILNLKVIRFFVLGPQRERRIIFNIYLQLIKKVFSPSLHQVVTFFSLLRKDISLKEKQNVILQRYLSPKCISKLSEDLS